MPRKKIVAIIISIIQLLTLASFIIANQPLSAIATIALLFISISYMRAKGLFENKIPGHFYTLANYTIGFTIAIGVLLVDFFLINHQILSGPIFNIIYIIEIIAGALFTAVMFIADHKKHTPGNPQQNNNSIIFITLSTAFLLATIVISLITTINFAI